MLALSWNVRGLGKEVKRRKVRGVVLKLKPAICFLQETKMGSMDIRISRGLGGSLLGKSVGVDADGSTGGLLTLWNEDLVSIKDCISNKWCIILVGVLNKFNRKVVLCNVYAPVVEKDRRDIWGFILQVQQSLSIPWCIGGDFNTVLNEAERKGGEFNKWSAAAFNNFMLQAKVIDIPLRGGDFTWSNNRVGGSWTRLDRFLVSPIILSWFSNFEQIRLPRLISDHHAIGLGAVRAYWGPRPFRFSNCWLEEKSLMEDINKEWVENKIIGSSSSILLFKLRGAKRKIKRWVAANMKDKNSTKELEDRLGNIDVEAARTGWTDGLRKDRLDAVSDLWKGLRREEQQWKQKSRVKWLLEDDRNTRFFHSVASGRRRMNLIENIAFEGVIRSKPDEVSSGVADFFEQQFRNVQWSRPKVRGLPLKKLSVGDKNFLEESFSVEEVKVALDSCDGNKAPGPDGFNLNFIKENWSVISGDFMNFLEEFHRDGRVVKEINRSFITLIPKCVKPKIMKDFRPISLVGSFYKILAKILANRLRRVIGTVVGDTQMAFIKDRHILDGFVIAEEIIHYWKKGKEGGLMVKLDFEKAYDSVDHSFLDDILGDMGFGQKWRQWMRHCIVSPRISVLVNGSPTREFGLERGLRQGDPLSPFLFNVVVEGLSALFRKVESLDMMKGVSFRSDEVMVSHLQFADDTIMFLKPRVDDLINVRRILRCFEVASGLRINFKKSCPGCKLFWKEIVQRLERRMAPWKKSFLNKGGRSVLIKNVMSSIPIYFMSMFKIPVGVAQNIEKLQRSFFWGDGVEKRKVHAMKWDTLRKSKENGGLGFGSVLDKNKGLLAKWVWRFGREESSLRKRVICAKYGVAANAISWNWNGGAQCSSFIKATGGLFEQGSTIAKVLEEGIQVIVGSGDRARLWEDIRIEGVRLKEAFPRIFSLTSNKSGSVKEFGRWSGGRWFWKIDLRRPCFDWEQNQWIAFNSCLDNIVIRDSISDTIGWSWCSTGQFSVKLVWKNLEENFVGNSAVFNRIWKSICPPKVEIFVWHLLHGRVLVRNALKRFGLISNNIFDCPMCGEAEESIDHLFLNCKWAWNLWGSCMNWWNISSCSTNSLLDWWLNWPNLCNLNSAARAWSALFFAMTWTIWEARNERVFKDVSISFEKAVDMVKFRVGWWFKYIGKGSKEPITLILLNIAERCVDVKTPKLPKHKDWMSPKPELLKFNVDGSARGVPGHAGVGEVLRDCRGRVLCVFSDSVGIQDSVTAELSAIAKACGLCLSRTELKGAKISVVSDCKQVVAWINCNGVGEWKYLLLILEIRSLLSRLNQVVVEYEPRETNHFADALAKRGADGGGFLLKWCNS
ncbi:hypothetical protein LWI29_006326 [Acer saccharum]|uniref:Reverse transcriptase domain-containing protein n=1 Tax=Acer saccharum TaxID=4024 RepID=A0AA39SUR2_ACESA|nr:hypothetical protein LWI29_006326 [Acer saccharum]